VKAVTWIGSFEVQYHSDVQHIRKADLMPFGGWPEGQDPYPDKDYMDIVQTIIHARKFMLAQLDASLTRPCTLLVRAMIRPCVT
jgi:hypothetical protein